MLLLSDLDLDGNRVVRQVVRNIGESVHKVAERGVGVLLLGQQHLLYTGSLAFGAGGYGGVMQALFGAGHVLRFHNGRNSVAWAFIFRSWLENLVLSIYK